MARDVTLDDPRYPPLVRAANALLGLAGGLGIPVHKLTVDGLLKSATRQNGGLDDFGDPEFLEGMRRVIDNVDTMGLSPFARQIVRATYLAALGHRLQLQALLKRRPEILTHKIERPIFVLGFPRTGTTTLQYLLAMGDDRRALEFWELLNPMPFAADRATDVRRRERAANLTLKLSYAVAPEMGVVHHIQPNTYEECWYVFVNTFRVLNWDLQTGFRDYGHWLLHEADMVQAYQEYKTYLQVLQEQDPRQHMVLKCPEHLWFVDSLLEVFPDACIIWTHRDPFDAVSSYCTLFALTRRLMYGSFNHKEMGPYVMTRFREAVDRALAAREAWGREETFFDVRFADLVQDTEGVARRLCAHFDLPWDPRHVQLFEQRKTEEERVDGPGAHRYSPEMMGVDRAQVHEVFADYIERFDIPIRKDKA
ncbi:MAG: sulfotransferase [Alphaproteobacteria bacterium]|nr:sulfotransferase [Alphaproteobacteria bacterium]